MFGPEVPTVRLGNRPADRQAEPRAGDPPGRPTTVELVEDLFELVRHQSLPAVADADPQLAETVAHADVYRLVRRRVEVRVLQEVADGGQQLLVVSQYDLLFVRDLHPQFARALHSAQR